ncbi:DUF7344 domain-containing protein [Natronococcus amylolyticus]
MNNSIQEVLSNPPRCRVLATLKSQDPPIPFTSLIDPGHSKEVRLQEITLFHNHLPNLDDAGFITWDQNKRLVDQGPRYHEICPYLNPQDNDDPGFGLGVFL